MAIQTRSSLLAVMVESTEGTPVIPSAATDFAPIQDDLSISPEFELLENIELKGSLGKSKSIQGAETPTASFSMYLRNSGTAGVAPQVSGELLQACFGDESLALAEYDTVASSTVSLIKVDTGEGASFERGEALMIKDGTNGYAIRPIHSISTDDLVPAFDLANAPASGVSLGQAVTYKPADANHQSLTLWNYLGNNGAIQMVAGVRVTEVGISFEAGQLINCSYSLEGIEYFFNPINITASDIYLDITTDNVTDAGAVITADMYKDPHSLAEAIQNALTLADPLETFTCVYSDTTGKFTIATSTSAVLSLLWDSGTNKANTIGDKIGFTVSADDTGSTEYTSDTALDWATDQTPSYNSTDPLVAKANEVLIGDSDDNTCFAASTVDFTISTPKRNINSICATSGISGSIINDREITVSVTALLNQHDADKFRRYRSNADTRFMYAFGNKSGTNWVAGQCGCIYLPNCTISSFNLSDDDGLVSLEMELMAYVDSDGNGEAYISFV